MRGALPFLQRAGFANVTVIDPPRHGAERADPGERLSTLLDRHGVKVEVTILARSMPKVSDVLTQHLRDTSADLLVVGAYGHSRLREFILGGVTRTLMQQMTVPVLMSH